MKHIIKARVKPKPVDGRNNISCPYPMPGFPICEWYGSDRCDDCIPLDPLCDLYSPSPYNTAVGGDLHE